MRTQVQKWGNSLAVRIPKSYASESRIEEGSVVRISVEGGAIVLSPENEFRLKDLLDGVSRKNIRREIRTGRAIGKEVW